MRPTKEECVNMLTLVESLDRLTEQKYAGLKDLRDFLARCQKSLPSQASVEKDRVRRKKVK